MRVSKGLRESFVLVLIVSALMVGCASSQPAPAPVPEVKADRPAWVDQGGGAFPGDRGKALYAVGSAWGIKNPSMMRTTASNNARAEMAKIFNTYTEYMMNQYRASTMKGDPSTSSDPQHVEEVVQTIAAGEVSGAQVVDMYFDSAEKVQYAIVRLGFDGFMDNIEQSKELNEKDKEIIVKSAEEAHKQMDAEVQKLKSGK